MDWARHDGAPDLSGMHISDVLVINGTELNLCMLLKTSQP